MYGIKHTELEWFSSYLDKRKQAVLCHNKLSSLADITTGVPQGSVLGPFLFLFSLMIYRILQPMAVWLIYLRMTP